MKLELNGDLSNHSDYSNDQQNSNLSSNDFIPSSTDTTNIVPISSNVNSILTSTAIINGSTSFISLDGLSSGVPTQTTPTLTPTTLRNIEQTFIELQNSDLEHRDQAGFVPPIVLTTINNNINNSNNNNNNNTTLLLSSSGGGGGGGGIDTDTDDKSMWTNSDSGSVTSVIMRPTPPVTPREQQHNDGNTKTRRNGGRRPNKNINMTPEEEQRRNMRRERNKIAAARCRKRRLDHTNALLEETEGLEQKKLALQNEIEELQAAKDELQYVLERHRAHCRIQQTFNQTNNQSMMATNHMNSIINSHHRPDTPPDIKPCVYHLIESADDTVLQSIRVKEEIDSTTTTTTSTHAHDDDDDDDVDFTTPPGGGVGSIKNKTLNALHNVVIKPNRPCSLNVITTSTASSGGPGGPNKVETIAGIPITTPSAALPFNFDSLMEGGTGLTPVSGPLIPTTTTTMNKCNNQSNNNQDLITPTTDTKLVSL